MSAVTDAVLERIDASEKARLERLFELVRIPSISTDPAFEDECARAAAWLADTLRTIGADASMRATEGRPMVVAHLPGPADAFHVLFYGHYDVQPADPLALWNSEPFEPLLRPAPDGDTHIVGRGASDDKGALLTFVEACRAWVETQGSMPLRVSFLFEGEEESGSRSLEPFLQATAGELACDAVLVCDTDMWDANTPAVTTMLRGLVGQQMTVTCADRDLHSGMFGSAARNALTLTSELLASLRTPDGAVAIDGFYDGVEPAPEALLERWRELPFDDAAFLADIGLSIPAGEQGHGLLEQLWTRPTCEIHGVLGGYVDPGFKTVIPHTAMAKLSFRLVAGQDPVRIRDAFQQHVRTRLPADCTVVFEDHGLSPAVSMPLDSGPLNAVLAALAEEWGMSTVAGTGGSIPIVGALKQHLGADALLVGFARFDNRIHAPNEKYDLSSYNRGTRSWVHVIDRLAALPGTG